VIGSRYSSGSDRKCASTRVRDSSRSAFVEGEAAVSTARSIASAAFARAGSFLPALAVEHRIDENRMGDREQPGAQPGRVLQLTEPRARRPDTFPGPGPRLDGHRRFPDKRRANNSRAVRRTSSSKDGAVAILTFADQRFGLIHSRRLLRFVNLNVIAMHAARLKLQKLPKNARLESITRWLEL